LFNFGVQNLRDTPASLRIILKLILEKHYFKIANKKGKPMIVPTKGSQ
jgi:hypothetical protein